MAVAVACCAPATPASALVVGTATPVNVVRPVGVFTEIPPEVLPGGGRLSLYLTTDRSARCDVPAGQAVGRVPFIDCTPPGRSVEQLVPDETLDHRRNYSGAFSAEHVQDAAGRFHVVTATHGENKNERRGDRLLQNTVYLGDDALVPPDGECVSGIDPRTGVYADCYAAYSGFVGTAVAPVTRKAAWGQATPRDLGPAVWPIGGYSSGDRRVRLSHGVRHPSVLRGGDGFVYLFYHDDGLQPGNVRGGFRVARAPERRLGRGWRTWVAPRRRWVASLPPLGTGRAGLAAALSRPSPAHDSEAIFASSASVMMVARVRGRRGFVAIDQGRNYDRPCTTPDGRADWFSATRMRVSPDGVTWSAPIELLGPDFDACDFYATSRLTYPRLLDASGVTTKAIDLRRFQVLGTRYGGQVWKAVVRAPELSELLPRSRRAAPAEPRRPAIGR